MITVTWSNWVRCPECRRDFNLLDDGDAEEWHYGHDCEDDTTQEDYVAVP